MATGKSGYFELTGNKGVTLLINWAETYEVATNKSTVSITSIQVKSSSYYEVIYYPKGTIASDGTTVITMDSTLPTHSVYVTALNAYGTLSGNMGSLGDILHNGDGTKNVTISVNITGYTADGKYGSGWNVSGSKSVSLTTIARTSVPTVATGSARMGSTVTIWTNRKATSLTHTLSYTFGGTKGTIATGVGDSYQWTVPDLAARISGSTSGSCVITCQTYSGSTLIGSKAVSIVLFIPAASEPTVSAGTVQMGTSVLISTNRKSTAYTHKIEYTIGSKTEVISSSVGSTVAWTPHKDLAAYTGNKKSATCTITCTTYNGSAEVGTKTVSITLNVPPATVITLDKSSVAVGQTLTISAPRETTAYTHDLAYHIAGLDGTIVTDVSSGHIWGIPVTFAAKFPEETSAAVTVICTTRFKGSTEVVGTSTATFTATVPKDETTLPKVEMALECVSDLPSKFAGVYVVGKTKVKVTYEASSDCSTIDSYTTTFLGVIGDGNPYISPMLSNAGQIAITGRVEDKRGYSTTVTDSISVEPYSRPRILPGEDQNSIICTRCDSNGKADASGTWLLIEIGRKYSPVGNKNTCKLSYRHKTDTAADYSDPIELLAAGASSDYVSVRLQNIVPSTTTAYSIQLIAEDDMGETDIVTVTIPTAFTTAHAPEGGHGLTVGGYHDPSKYDWFVCAFDAEFQGEVKGLYAIGVTDGWSWRKDGDGIAECWRRVSQTVDITNSKGYMYYGACQDISFPFTFKEVPVCNTSVESNNILMIGSYGNTSTTKPARICVFKPQDANPEEELTVVYHAIGRWK